MADLEDGLFAATAAKFPAVDTGQTGDGFVISLVVCLLGVLLTRFTLLFGVGIVLFTLEFSTEFELLFIVVLEARTAIGLMGCVRNYL